MPRTCTAETTFGWQWPVLVTPMPDAKSKNLRPSDVHTQLPSPRLATTSWRSTEQQGQMGGWAARADRRMNIKG
eukprot:351829-Chlamydomonas_euryale.AAC.2